MIEPADFSEKDDFIVASICWACGADVATKYYNGDEAQRHELFDKVQGLQKFITRRQEEYEEMKRCQRPSLEE